MDLELFSLITPLACYSNEISKCSIHKDAYTSSKTLRLKAETSHSVSIIDLLEKILQLLLDVNSPNRRERERSKATSWRMIFDMYRSDFQRHATVTCSPWNRNDRNRVPPPELGRAGEIEMKFRP